MPTASASSTIAYPRSAFENLRFRAQLLEDAERDPYFAKELWKYCKDNPIFWIDNFCWTKNPRLKESAVLPFICYPFQIEAFLEIKQAMTEGYDLLIEKTRDMGISWLVLYAFQHEFQFGEGADFRVGSRKEEYVDKIGVMDTLLEKVRFNLSRQPLYLLPDGFESESDFEDQTSYMRLRYPKRGNAIIGESANAHFGSGGRSKAILLDEFAKWESGIDGNAWTSTADVTNCRIVVSTPVGSANKFAQLACGTEEKIKKLTLHWTLHPEKQKGAYYLSNGVRIDINLEKDPKAAYRIWKDTFGRESKRVFSPFYDAECERRSDSDVAQELDIDYHRSGAMFFNARALARQRVWKYQKRQSPNQAIPYGSYIRGILLEVDGKVKFKETEDGWLYLAETPKPGYQYVLAGDSAEGLEKSDECFGVVRCKVTENVQAIFHAQEPPEDFAIKMQLVGWYFHEADNVPENNNHGYTTAKELSEKSHVKLYHSRDEKGQVTDKRGFSTSNKTRPDMLNHLAHQIDKGEVELRFDEILSQCRTFVRNAKKAGRPEADGSFNDDGVIACAIAGYVIREIPYEPRATTGTRQREMVDDRNRRKNAGFGF